MSRPDFFNIQHTHTDVRLALGWASVLISAATGLYGWKVEFERAKPVVIVGVVL
jgi:signal peptidase complex subunit 2